MSTGEPIPFAVFFDEDAVSKFRTVFPDRRMAELCNGLGISDVERARVLGTALSDAFRAGMTHAATEIAAQIVEAGHDVQLTVESDDG